MLKYFDHVYPSRHCSSSEKLGLVSYLINHLGVLPLPCLGVSSGLYATTLVRNSHCLHSMFTLTLVFVLKNNNNRINTCRIKAAQLHCIVDAFLCVANRQYVFHFTTDICFERIWIIYPPPPWGFCFVLFFWCRISKTNVVVRIDHWKRLAKKQNVSLSEFIRDDTIELLPIFLWIFI